MNEQQTLKQRCTALKLMVVTLAVAFMPSIAAAATTGAEFETFYTFIYEAATGYLGRGIALAGGLIGLGIGAGSGKAIPAIIGVVLALFGALGPSIVNAIFGSALI